MADHTETEIHPLFDEETDELEAPSSTISIPPRRKKRRRGWLILVVVLLLIGATVGGVFYWRASRVQPVTYTQQAVTSGNLTVSISATGPISPNAQYAMNFAVAGQVSEIDVQVGQQVKQGQTLAKVTVDRTALQASIDQDQLAVTAANNALNASYTNLTTAQTNATNTKNQNAAALQVAYDQEQSDINTCQTEKSPPANCVQTAQDKYAQTAAQLTTSTTTAQNQVTNAQQAITTAQDNLTKAQSALQDAINSLTDANNNAVMTAPANATVAAITGVVGQNVTTGGGSSSNAFLTLIDTSKLSILSQVNEADIGNVQVGQTARFTLAAFPSQTFRATVTAIDAIGQTTSNVVSYTVHLAVDSNSLGSVHVYPGMTASVSITTAQRIGTLLIPSSALSFTTTALRAGEISRTDLAAVASNRASSSGDTRVVLVLKNGKLTPVLITVGLSSGQFTEVLSGLKEGDMVVTSQAGGNISTGSTSTGTGTGTGTGGGRGTGGGGFGGGGFGGGGFGGGGAGIGG